MSKEIPDFDQLREAFGYFGDLDELKKKVEAKRGKKWKFDIELQGEINSIFSQLAKEKGVPVGELVRNALASYVYLQKELNPESGEERHLVIRDDEQILQRIKLP